MKYIVFLLSLFCFSASYGQEISNEWQKVYELEKEGSYRLALEKSEGLYAEGIKNKNEVEVLKTFFYKQKFSNKLGIAVSDITEIEKNISLVSEPTKLFYYLIAANELATELLQDFYEINQRKATTDPLNEKQRSEWMVNDYLEEIERYQNLTFANPTLNSSLIKPYKNVISIKDKQNGLYETYFEFFAMEWINLFHSLEREGVTASKENYTLSNHILDFTNQFYQYNFSEKGLQAINLYQKLEKYYLDKQNTYLFDKIRYTRLKTMGLMLMKKLVID